MTGSRIVLDGGERITTGGDGCWLTVGGGKC